MKDAMTRTAPTGDEQVEAVAQAFHQSIRKQDRSWLVWEDMPSCYRNTIGEAVRFVRSLHQSDPASLPSDLREDAVEAGARAITNCQRGTTDRERHTASLVVDAVMPIIGVPRVAEMHPLDRAFYELVVKERDYERHRVDRLERELAEARTL